VIRKLIVGLCAAAAILLAAVSFLWALDVAVPGRAHGAELACHGQQGIASWYGAESGHRTATGEYFDGSSLTAAMPSRSMLGKRVRVTDMRTGRSVVVRVNDIGPARWTHRVIDLSRASARALGMGGLARVCVLLTESGGGAG
jgi:rare lipoprotein A